MTCSARYAVYYAPEEGSGFERLGAAWTGRDARTGETCEQVRPAGIDPGRFSEITAFPRHYGFHGTLKAPFHLKEGFSARDLYRAAADFAETIRPFSLPPLRPAWMNRFLALKPAEPCPELEHLAAACVRGFDPFRAPLDRAEFEKRRAKCANPRQVELLARWGYPYVMEEFRFHITLTGTVDDPTERLRLKKAAVPLLRPVCSTARPLREICIFEQSGPESPFRLTRRFPFRKGAGE
jgi:putative phosphonate metabolism protein